MTWEKEKCPLSVLGGSFLEKIYQCFVGSLETVSFIRVSVLRWPEPIYVRVGYVFDLRFSE